MKIVYKTSKFSELPCGAIFTVDDGLHHIFMKVCTFNDVDNAILLSDPETLYRVESFKENALIYYFSDATLILE